jgi:hypothetical protein
MATRRLTRDQIAKIVNNDPEAIRAFEDLFRQATTDQPAELVTLRADVDGLALDPAGSDALEALSWLSRLQAQIDQPVSYAEIIKTADQVAAVINTATAVTWTSAGIAQGVSIGSPASRIVMARAGTYKFDLFAQLSSTSASAKNLWLWFAKNGTAIANSAAIETETGNNAFASMFRSELIEVSAGDYVEAFFAVDDVALFLNAEAATAFAPAAPAAHLAVTQVAP